MENNRLNNIMNRNWNTMSEILDKEMPIETKKRGLWVWFLLIGSLTLSSAIFVFQYNNNDVIVKPNQVKTSTNEILANTTPQIIQSPLQSVKDKQFIQNTNAEQKVLSSTNEQTNKITPNISSLISNDGHANNNLRPNVDHDVIANSILIEGAPQQKELLTTNMDRVEPSILFNSNPQLIGLNNELTHNTHEVEILPTISNRLVLHKKEIPLIPIPKSSKTSYNLGLVASTATTNFTSLSSFFAGVQGEKKLSTAFSVYANLGWRQYTGTNINIQDEPKSLDRFEISNTNVGTNQNADQELNQLIIRDITKTINYLELASGVKYQLFNRFSLMGGMNLGYLVSESYEIDEETRVTYPELAKKYELNYVNSNADQTNLHQKWTAHVNVGVEARLSKSVFVYSNIHHLVNSPTNDVSPSDKVNDNKNWLELGVKYNFIK